MFEVVPISFVPFLIVESLVVMVSGMDCEVLCNPSGKLQLLVYFVKEQVVFLCHHSVTVSTVFAEDLEA